MGKLILMTVAMLQALGLGVLAMASDRREPASLNRATMKSDVPMAAIRGTLVCAGGESEDGKCDLQLTTGSGRTIDLSHNSDAMRLYKAGKREVAIEGRQTGDFVQVRGIRAL